MSLRQAQAPKAVPAEKTADGLYLSPGRLIGDNSRAIARNLAESDVLTSLNTKTYLLAITAVALFTALVSVVNLQTLNSRLSCPQPSQSSSLSLDQAKLKTLPDAIEGWRDPSLDVPEKAQIAALEPVSSSPKDDFCSRGSCHNPTKSGHCPQQLLTAYDEAYKEVWPGRVDLLIRYFINEDLYKIQILFHSIDLFWPKNIGDIIVVLDEGNQWGASLLPHGVKIFYEKNYMNLPGKVLQQWSYLWADNYTTAEFISVVDDDAMFVMKVTPSLLFNLTTGKPYVLGHKMTNSTWMSRQHFVWTQSTEHFLGKGNYWGLFMTQLPFTFPRSALPKFREFSGHRFPHVNYSFDNAMKWWSQHAKAKRRNHICHTVLGNFMHLQMPNEVQIVEETSESAIPIPRTASHHSYNPHVYIQRQKVAEGKITPYQFQKLYVQTAGPRLLAGLCDAFPGGEMRECSDANMTLNAEIWMYVDWHDWHKVFKSTAPEGTVVYDRYKAEMKCLYERLVEGCNASFATLKKDLKACVREDSGVKY